MMATANKNLIEKLDKIAERIGNTPVVQVEHEKINLYAKLEYTNFMGSVKARAACAILRGAIESGEINQDTLVIESSSGNFAVAISAICNILGIKFVAVIDPHINKIYSRQIRNFSHEVITVDKKDINDGYLMTKLAEVKRYCESHDNTFWTNQYDNPNNFDAHYHGTGGEICARFEQLDYAFIAVASCGTISGVSSKLKAHYPGITIVGVDAEGSVIFGGKPRARLIPGMGSGMVPPLLQRATVDEVVTVKETETLAACQELFYKHALYLGGSSGTAYGAVNLYFRDKQLEKRPNVVFICPDRGTAYADNVYNPEWIESFHKKQEVLKQLEQGGK